MDRKLAAALAALRSVRDDRARKPLPQSCAMRSSSALPACARHRSAARDLDLAGALGKAL